MAEGTIYKYPAHNLDYTPVAAVTAGDVVMLADGKAGVCTSAIAAGVLGAAQTTGIATVTKTSGVVLLQGSEVYWDHSAGSCTYAPANDEDFFLGTVVGADAASADTTCKVLLNERPNYKIDLGRGQASDGATTAIVGSATCYNVAGSTRLACDATTEAQKVDILSLQGFDVDADGIVEFAVTIVDDGDDAALDFNIGVANATHASDADSITESVFVHTDGNVVNLLAESDDGTTEVAATDTTIDYTLGTTFYGVMDFRTPGDVQIYLNGALVLSGTTFNVAAATGPFKLLAHLEKSSNNTTAEIYVHYMRVRTADY